MAPGVAVNCVLCLHLALLGVLRVVFLPTRQLPVLDGGEGHSCLGVRILGFRVQTASASAGFRVGLLFRQTALPSYTHSGRLKLFRPIPMKAKRSNAGSKGICMRQMLVLTRGPTARVV